MLLRLLRLKLSSVRPCLLQQIMLLQVRHGLCLALLLLHFSLRVVLALIYTGLRTAVGCLHAVLVSACLLSVIITRPLLLTPSLLLHLPFLQQLLQLLWLPRLLQLLLKQLMKQRLLLRPQPTLLFL